MELHNIQSRMHIILPLRIKNILEHLAQKPKEWSAFAEVETIKTDCDIDFYIKELYFPKQQNGGATTDIEAEDMIQFTKELMKQKVDLSTIKCWIHSHNSMQAFWSATDTKQMNSFLTGEFGLSIVVSQRGDWQGCFTLYSPIQLTLKIPIIVDDVITDKETLEKYEKELGDKEIIEIPTSVFPHWQNTQSPSPYDDYDYDYENWHSYYDKAKQLSDKPKLSKKEKKQLRKTFENKPFSIEELEYFKELIEEGYTRDSAMKMIYDLRY